MYMSVKCNTLVTVHRQHTTADWDPEKIKLIQKGIKHRIEYLPATPPSANTLPAMPRGPTRGASSTPTPAVAISPCSCNRIEFEDLSINYEDGKYEIRLLASITPWRLSLHASHTTLILSSKSIHGDITSINLSHGVENSKLCKMCEGERRDKRRQNQAFVPYLQPNLDQIEWMGHCSPDHASKWAWNMFKQHYITAKRSERLVDVNVKPNIWCVVTFLYL